jgi:hypothetical protein
MYLSLGSVSQTDRETLDVMTGGATSQIPGKTLECALGCGIPGRLHGLVQCIDLERASLNINPRETSDCISPLFVRC